MGGTMSSGINSGRGRFQIKNDDTQLAECLTRCLKPWVQSPAQHRLGATVHTCGPSLPVVEARRSQIQSHRWLHSEYEASLSYMRPCVKTNNNKPTHREHGHVYRELPARETATTRSVVTFLGLSTLCHNHAERAWLQSPEIQT